MLSFMAPYEFLNCFFYVCKKVPLALFFNLKYVNKYFSVVITIKSVLTFFSFIFINWRLFTLQYCSGFCHALTWVSHGWIRKLWYIYTMEYYSAIKENSFESVLMRWMKLEPIIQSEVSQKDKDQYSILTHIYGI